MKNAKVQTVIDLKIGCSRDPKKGILPHNLKKGDVVFAKIIDSRDIAQYLSKLLGGKQQDEIIPLTTVIEKIEKDGETFILYTKFGPGVFGKDIIIKDERVEVDSVSRGLLRILRKVKEIFYSPVNFC